MTNQSSQTVQDPNTAGGGTQSAGDGQNTQQAPLTYDAWFGALPDEQKTLIEGHITGLKSALASEREGKNTLDKSLKALQKKFEKESDEFKELEGLRKQMAETQRQNAFYENSLKAGVAPASVKTAWKIAVADELVDDDGDVDFEKFKAEYPQLFAQPTQTQKKTPAGNAGTGTQQQAAPEFDMNTALRRAAGFAN